MATPDRQLERSATEARMLEIVRELLRDLGKGRLAESVALHSSLERDFGLCSLDLLELMVRCEARFEVELPDEITEEAATPSDWVKAVIEGGRETGAKTAYRIPPPRTDGLPEPFSAATMAEVLVRHAEADPGRVQIHLLAKDAGQGITYGRLYEEASAVAAGLADQGLIRNETVAIMLPNCADFFFAFFGVMLAGGIPVPVYPPTRPDRIEDYVRRQIVVLRRAGARMLISFDRVRTVVQILRVNVPTLAAVTTVEELRRSRGRLGLGSVEPADAALLQFTSGSTGDPKAVTLSHENVLANIRAIGATVEMKSGDAVVSWLPLHSDLGLIGCWLLSVYYAVPCTILSPLDFLQRPERWLRAIHDSRGTLSPAPNFAYDLCARRIPLWMMEGVDLSCWRVAVNAGEPVLAETVDRFTERFRDYGFRPGAMMPCFGMAESTVALTMPPAGRLPVRDRIERNAFETKDLAVVADEKDPTALCFFSTGRAVRGQQIRLVDANGKEVPERTIGHLQFRGETTMAGYYRDAAATEAVTTPDGWIDSGDFGYFAGGEFFFTGRAREAIVKAGRSMSPFDVEAAVSAVPGVLPGSVVAFGAENPDTGAEEIVVAAETRVTSQEDYRRIDAEIARVVNSYFGVPPDKIQLVGPGCLPRTSNGKVRRNEIWSLYRKGKLRRGSSPPWLQIVRLRWENVGALVGLGVRRASSSVVHCITSALAALVAWTAGAWVRLGLGRSAVHVASRWILSLEGRRFSLQGAQLLRKDRTAVLVANRSGLLDPLVMAASIPGTLWFADVTALDGLPRSLACLLRPLVAGYHEGELAPTAGALEDRILRKLEEGARLVVFPDSPTGSPVSRSRFRLDPFRAAVRHGATLHPTSIRERAQRQQLRGKMRVGKVTMVVIREAIPVLPDTREPASGVTDPSEMISVRELFALRDRVREAIGESRA